METMQEHGNMKVDYGEFVLGALIMESRRHLTQMRSMLLPEVFRDKKQRVIFEVMCEMQDNGIDIDLVTLNREIRKRDEGKDITPHYLSSLTDRVASTANIESHARVLIEKHLGNEVLRMTRKAEFDAINGRDVFDVIDDVTKDIQSLLSLYVRRGERRLSDYTDEIRHSQKSMRDGVLPGIPSTFNRYNSNAGGYHNGNLIILAGRPGMGKTANMLNEALHAMELGHFVMIASLEMTGREIIQRLIANKFSIPLSKFARSPLPEDLVEETLQWAESLPLSIIEDSNLSVIRAAANLHKQTDNLSMVFVDYLQLIDAGIKDHRQNVEFCSRSLKALAKTLDIPVMAVAQLSRAVETRGGDRRPQLSDLRDSGQIEQDADVVEFMFRPEYYGFEIFNDIDTRNKAWRLNGKMRDGVPNLEIEMDWRPEFMRFSNPVLQPEDDETFDYQGDQPF